MKADIRSLIVREAAARNVKLESVEVVEISSGWFATVVTAGRKFQFGRVSRDGFQFAERREDSVETMLPTDEPVFMDDHRSVKVGVELLARANRGASFALTRRPVI